MTNIEKQSAVNITQDFWMHPAIRLWPNEYTQHMPSMLKSYRWAPASGKGQSSEQKFESCSNWMDKNFKTHFHILSSLTRLSPNVYSHFKKLKLFLLLCNGVVWSIFLWKVTMAPKFQSTFQLTKFIGSGLKWQRVKSNPLWSFKSKWESSKGYRPHDCVTHDMCQMWSQHF